MRFHGLSLKNTAVALLVAAGAPLYAGETVDRVVARLNEDILTATDFAEAAASGPGGDRLTTGLVGAVLDRTLLLQASRKQQVEVPSDDIQRQVEEMVREIRSHYKSEAAFRDALLRDHTSLEQLKADLAKKATTDFKAFRAVAGRFSIADGDVAQFEREAQAKGVPPESYQLRRLAVPVEGEGPKAQQAALDRVAALRERIESEGLDFAEGVRKYSPDPQARADGGDLGMMPATRLAKPVLDAVAKMKAGDVTRPMITGSLASIFYLEKKRGAKTVLYEKRFNEERRALLAELRRKAHLQVFDPGFAKVIPAEYRAVMTEESPVSSAPGNADTSPPPAPSPTPRKGGLGALFGRGNRAP